MFDEAVEQFGEFHAVVANAGSSDFGPIGPVTVLEDISADLYSDGRSAGAVFDGPDLAGVGGDAFV